MDPLLIEVANRIPSMGGMEIGQGLIAGVSQPKTEHRGNGVLVRRERLAGPRRSREQRGVVMKKSLAEIADRIPSMGGMEIGPALREFARAAGPNKAIVEVGCWLGAGTAQLALGVLENSDPTGIRYIATIDGPPMSLKLKRRPAGDCR